MVNLIVLNHVPFLASLCEIQDGFFRFMFSARAAPKPAENAGRMYLTQGFYA